MHKLNLEEAGKAFNDKANKLGQGMIVLQRNGERNKEKEITFASDCFTKVWNSLEDEVSSNVETTKNNNNNNNSESTTAPTTTASSTKEKEKLISKRDVAELLFFGQSFSLTSPNSELKWVKESEQDSYKYKKSKPSVENKRWVVKADALRVCLANAKENLASEQYEKDYQFNWKDLFRTEIVQGIMSPIAQNLLYSSPATRNLLFRHGIIHVIPLSFYIILYVKSNMLILRAFHTVFSHLQKKGEFWVLKDGSDKDDISKGFNSSVTIENFMEIPDKLVSIESFVTFAMHLPSSRFKEAAIFKKSDASDEDRKIAENAVCQAVNSVHYALNKILGVSKYKQDFDMNTIQDNVTVLRESQRCLYCMKKSLVNIMLPGSKSYLSKYVAIESRSGEKAIQPVLVGFDFDKKEKKDKKSGKKGAF